MESVKARKPTVADYIMAYSEHLGGITPTPLTRPHQGGGNALTICEYR
jgi:hypothetical protein